MLLYIALAVSLVVNIVSLFYAVRHCRRAHLLQNGWTERRQHVIEIYGLFFNFDVRVKNIFHIGSWYIPCDSNNYFRFRDAVYRQRLLDQLKRLKIQEGAVPELRMRRVVVKNINE